MFTIADVQPKPRTVAGIRYQPKETYYIYNVDIEPGVSVRVYGETRRWHGGVKPTFDKTYKIGDWAEYDSYNFSYHGQIVAIGKKTVTLKPRASRRTRRLDIYEFCWRNYDFDLARSEAENFKVSLEI